ncbi:MAG: YHS domain-containing protein [Cyclobacteriaceae bacterium]|nr:YHS domain-containing protein [Cyclobacteriaceae bacterium]
MRVSISILLLLGSIATFAQTDALRQKHYNLDDGLAIEGYDPVSYFDGKPVEGKNNLTYSYKGVIYRFSNQGNLAKFKSAPEKYEPAYGGWCAYAMGENGEKVKVDPETYKIVDGKLYLFYNFWANNTLEKWNKNETKLKEAGDRNWSKIVH